MIKKILLLGLMLLFIITVGIHTKVYAQDDEDILKVSLKSAIDRAIKASEDVQISDNEILRSSSELREEKSYLYPHISSITSWSDNYQYPDIPSTAYKENYTLDAGVTASQPIWAFGRLGSAISAAREEIDISRLEKETVEQEIIYTTKIAYYTVCFSKQVFEIFKQSYDRVQSNRTILENRSASGRVSKYDNIKIEADVTSRIPTVNNARASLHSAFQTLKMIIGVNPETIIDITDISIMEYRVLNKEKLVSLLYEKQPKLNILEKDILVKEDTIKKNKAEYFPIILAFATWNYKGSGNSYNVGSENLHDYGVVGVEVNVPIWDGGYRKEKLQQTIIDKHNAELSLQKTTKNFLLELDNAIVEYHEFVKILLANGDAVRLANEAFKMSQDLFSSGQISVTDLNDAELFLTREKLNKEMTLFNINITLAKIEKLTATGINNE